MDDTQRKKFSKRWTVASQSNISNEKFTKKQGNLTISTNNPVQKRARSYQDLNQKANDYSHVESKVKKYIQELQKEDRSRSITRTKSMPESSEESPFKNIENPNEDEDINLSKQQLLELQTRAARVAELNEETNGKIQKNLLVKTDIKRSIDNLRYQLDRESNSRNPIGIIRKVCTPRKNQKEERMEAVIHPTSTTFLSQSFTLTDNSMLDSVEDHPILKRQLKYFHLNEHFDMESEDSDSPDNILLTDSKQSKSERFKKKIIKVFFGKCVDKTCLEGNHKSSVDSKIFSADSAYNSNY